MLPAERLPQTLIQKSVKVCEAGSMIKKSMEASGNLAICGVFEYRNNKCRFCSFAMVKLAHYVSLDDSAFLFCTIGEKNVDTS